MGRGDQAPLIIIDCRHNAEAVLGQFLGNAAHPFASDRIGLDVTVNDQDRELEVLVHEGAPAPNDGSVISG
ncbi:hypothetical protein D3C72_1757000 [compost metagenome]